MIGQFLFWLQECKKEVFVVATANEVTSLPAELLRKGRFDEIFFIDLPTPNERKDIINLYLKKYLNVAISDNLLNRLIEISDGFAGSDIETSLRDITYKVLANNISLTEDLMINTFKSAIPLSKSNPDRIARIRKWGLERALPASDDNDSNNNINNDSISEIETL